MCVVNSGDAINKVAFQRIPAVSHSVMTEKPTRVYIEYIEAMFERADPQLITVYKQAMNICIGYASSTAIRFEMRKNASTRIQLIQSGIFGANP
jgi:hypothetical protein